MTTAAAIRQTIQHFLSETFFADSVGGEASFMGEGIIDSTGMLELVQFVESTYRLSIADSELIPENLDSVNNLVAFIQRKTTR